MTEYELCEKPIIEALESIGWRYVPGRELPRESYEEPLLVERLKDAILRMAESEGLELEEDDVQRAILRLKNPGATAQGVREILNYLKNGAIPLDLGKKGLRYIPIIDYDDFGSNEFTVSNQVEFRGPGGRIKADIVLFVNGIPLVIIECKDPASEKVSWYDAYLDIKGYERRVEEPFKYIQFGVAADALEDDRVRVFPIVSWMDDVSTSVWRDEEGNAGIKGLRRLLEPGTLLDIVKNFVFVTQRRGEDVRILPRYMQYYATNRIYRRAIERMEGKSGKSRGLIWHWQGSGKTYTMIFSAYKLYMDRRMEKPTIFFIVDRRELQDQIGKVLGSMDLGSIAFEKIGTIRDFRNVLRHDGGRGKRGLFILLIQKFRPDEEEGIDEEELRKAIEGQELGVSERKNIVLFIDEGHRTQYGVLASEMRRIFRNAFMFAFTGTPISKVHKDTYREFSYPEEGENYLHRYFIDDSIEDGYTVPIVYTFLKESMDFDKNVFEGGVEKIFGEEDDETKEEVHRRFKTINELLSKPEMIEKKARNIIDSFMARENRELKGMVVAANRKACVLYKRAIDRYLEEKYPEEYSEDFASIVMTFAPKEKEREVEEYSDEMRRKYPSLSTEAINRSITDRFREERNPQLLIVTDMLLTGFDAPLLQILYLDKVMNGHTLLQAIARTNRPHEKKGYGLVVDYVGLFKRFTDALEDYYEIEGKASSVATNISDLELELEMALEEIEELLGDSFNPELINSGDRAAMNRAISAIMEIREGRNNEEDFIRIYRKIMKIYELLGPSEIKVERQVKKRVDALRKIYAIYRKRFGKEIDPKKIDEYIRELRDTLYESVKIENVGGEFFGVRMDEEFLKELRSELDKDEGVILDMASVLNRYVLKLSEKPWSEIVYGDIIKSVENAVERWRRRITDPESTFDEFLRIIMELGEMEEEREKLSVTEREYPIFLFLKNTFGDEELEDYVRFIKKVMEELESADLLFTGWYEKAETKRRMSEILRQELVHFLVVERRMEYGEIRDVLERVVDEIINILETARA